MRVALTLDACWYRPPGGTGVAAARLARGLASTPGVEIAGIAGRHGGPPAPHVDPGVEVRHHWLPRPLLADAWQWLERPRVESLVGDVDLVHATTVVVPATRRPLVVTVHDLFSVEHPEWFTPRGARVMRRGVDRIRRRAGLVLCSSQATLRAAEAAGIGAERLRLVPLGVAPEPLPDGAVEAVRSRYELPERWVLWNGTFEPRKNLAGLLSAWRAVPVTADAELVLVGPPGWRDALPDVAATLGDRAASVRTLGEVPASELAALHRGAVLTCLPSLAEGFGFPVLEAMIQGTPVVTSRGTSTEELVGDAGLLVDPTDTDELADALTRVLIDAGLRDRLAERAVPTAATFTWERTVEATVEAYQELLG